MRLFHFARHVPLCQRGERPGLKGYAPCRRRSDFQSALEQPWTPRLYPLMPTICFALFILLLYLPRLA